MPEKTCKSNVMLAEFSPSKARNGIVHLIWSPSQLNIEPVVEYVISYPHLRICCVRAFAGYPDEPGRINAIFYLKDEDKAFDKTTDHLIAVVNSYWIPTPEKITAYNVTVYYNGGSWTRWVSDEYILSL